MVTLNADFILNHWIPALRSGRYKQGKRRLRRGDQYCCLGVACDLLIGLGILQPWEEGIRTDDDEVPSYHVNGDNFFLPYEASSYIGFFDGSCEIPRGIDEEADMHSDYGPPFGVSLSRLNDDGWSFMEIADLLEKVVAHQKNA